MCLVSITLYACSDTDCSIILLFGWMGARFHQLLKYADPLHELFPSSTIVIIGSWAEFVWRSQSHLDSAMIPVVEPLQNEKNHRDRFRGALVHIISNGGGWQFMTLRNILSELQLSSPTTGRAPTALVLDSVPDDKGLKSSPPRSFPSKSHPSCAPISLSHMDLCIYLHLQSLHWQAAALC